MSLLSFKSFTKGNRHISAIPVYIIYKLQEGCLAFGGVLVDTGILQNAYKDLTSLLQDDLQSIVLGEYAQNYFLYQVLNIQIPPDLLIVRQIRGVYNGIQMKYNGKNM